MEQITVYKFEELPEEIQEKLVAKQVENNQTDAEIPWSYEIFDSLKELFNKCCKVKLVDWDLGLCNRNNHIKIEFNEESTKELTSARALGWLENNLLNNLRITRSRYLAKRKDYFSYGSSYRVGCIKPGPLTGICYDENYLDDLIEGVKNGLTLYEAFKSLADTYEKLLQQEYDAYTSEEYAREVLLDSDTSYTITGKEV
jgi:hypothetical protein